MAGSSSTKRMFATTGKTFRVPLGSPLTHPLRVPILPGVEHAQDRVCLPAKRPKQREQDMSEQMLALYRDRVATRYYERPEVIDAVARAILREPGTAQR